MSFEKIMTDLKAKKYAPIYFLMGDESYFIDKITNYIADKVLPESEKAFNQSVLYGKDTDIRTVITTAKRFPMMAEHQVLIVKEAQHLKRIDDLAYYAEKPLKSTILVFNYKFKTLDKRKKVYKLLKKKAVLFESKKLYDYQIPEWIKKYLASKKIGLSPEAGRLLADSLGNDLSKITNELDKLIITIPAGQSQITPDLIEKNIGISKDFNTFELQKALVKKDVLKANRIINYFGQNQREHPMVLIISSLFFFFKKVLLFHFLPNKTDRIAASALKINPYFVKEYKQAAQKYSPRKTVEIISLLRQYDLKSKGVENASASPGELLKELIFKILH